MSEPRIWILPPEVAERIAAGEVVERPASAVKELVENALDAGARRVSVETEDGGKRLLRITDDGCGMSAEEVGLAIQRHATSKLRSAEDLFDIHTLGFRGEALPSIASVSELEIVTRRPEDAGGTRVLIRGGEVASIEPSAAAVGTVITVRNLFYNLPVRHKFLRSASSEQAQITDWLERLAISHPEVSFRLTHEGREAMLSPGSANPINAVVATMGRAVAREMVPIQWEEPADDSPEPREDGPIRVEGFAGRPTLTRSSRSHQYSFVNGRSVRSPSIGRAIDDAYRSSMPSGRHPVVALSIHVPPGSVDVNVHPAKTEVRFRDEARVHAAVRRAIREALRLVPGADAAAAQPDLNLDLSQESRVAEQPVALEATPRAPLGVDLPIETPFANSMLAPPTSREHVGSGGAAGSAQPAFTLSRPPAATPPPARSSAPPPPAASFLPISAPGLPELELLGQVKDLFILARSGAALWVIDQHVAHERVLFDRLMAGVGAASSQALLLPYAMEVTASQELALRDTEAQLAELGFRGRPAGPNRWEFEAIPVALQGRDYPSVLRDLVDELPQLRSSGSSARRLDDLAAAAAGRSCKRAIKAGKPLSHAEMDQLLRDLSSTDNPHTCPHGRPVFLRWNRQELDTHLFAAACGTL